MSGEIIQQPYEPVPRQSGILLHPTSFSSPYGIGDLGSEAYRFIDFLQKAGQHLWQVLPLTHTGYGDSPYQSFSAFAGQPLIISPAHLSELGLISDADLTDCPTADPEHIDYGTIIPWKTKLLKKAFRTFSLNSEPVLHDAFHAFIEQEREWLFDYGLFMALKDLHGGESWLSWEPEYRFPDDAKKVQWLEEQQESVQYYLFIQFLFFQEWKCLKQYANERDIKIIGDIPIFVSMDSADVWANQYLFQLNENGFPLSVAGVPPDYFSAEGQLWGNPLYNWDVHRENGYAWWLQRMKSQFAIVDYVRIDHFRGFESFWSVPYGEQTAVNGHWVKGPGADFFRCVADSLGAHLPIIAEDLGIITHEVGVLRDAFAFPGMKVLQFGFEDSGESSFLPHQFTTPNCVCYTGTHDNDTTAGWFETVRNETKQKVQRYMKTDGDDIGMDFIRTCLGTIAQFAVFPMQDVLGIGKEGRMNTPGVPAGNWNWRYKIGSLSDTLAVNLRELSHLYGRY